MKALLGESSESFEEPVEAEALQSELQVLVKRTVVSHEETKSAANAPLGESSESFEEPVEAAWRPVDWLDGDPIGFCADDEAAAAVAWLEDDPVGSCANDEAAAAVAGLEPEMFPDNNEDWYNREAIHEAKQADKEASETGIANIPSADQQDEEDESIEIIEAEIRESSTFFSNNNQTEIINAEPDEVKEEASGGLGKALAKENLTPLRSFLIEREGLRGGRFSRGRGRTVSESSGREVGYESSSSMWSTLVRNIRGGRGNREIASPSQSDMDNRNSGDLFDFQESDESSGKEVGYENGHSLLRSFLTERGGLRGVRFSRGRGRTVSECSGREVGYEFAAEGEGTPRGRGKVARNGAGCGYRRMASPSQSDMDNRNSGALFDFQESDESSGKEVGYESAAEGEGTPRGRGKVARIGGGCGIRSITPPSQSDMDNRNSGDVLDFQESDEETVNTNERQIKERERRVAEHERILEEERKKIEDEKKEMEDRKKAMDEASRIMEEEEGRIEEEKQRMGLSPISAVPEMEISVTSYARGFIIGLLQRCSLLS